MRRKDRQTDEQTAYEFFNAAPYATIAFKGDIPYCIPISTAMLNRNIYFHCAKEGTKLDMLAKDPSVCLSAVSRNVPATDKFTTYFASAVVFGRAEIVNDDNEKIAALRAICEKYTPDNMEKFDKAILKSLAVTVVIKVTVDSITGKQKVMSP